MRYIIPLQPVFTKIQREIRKTVKDANFVMLDTERWEVHNEFSFIGIEYKIEREKLLAELTQEAREKIMGLMTVNKLENNSVPDFFMHLHPQRENSELKIVTNLSIEYVQDFLNDYDARYKKLGSTIVIASIKAKYLFANPYNSIIPDEKGWKDFILEESDREFDSVMRIMRRIMKSKSFGVPKSQKFHPTKEAWDEFQKIIRNRRLTYLSVVSIPEDCIAFRKTVKENFANDTIRVLKLFCPESMTLNKFIDDLKDKYFSEKGSAYKVYFPYPYLLNAMREPDLYRKLNKMFQQAVYAIPIFQNMQPEEVEESVKFCEYLNEKQLEKMELKVGNAL